MAVDDHAINSLRVWLDIAYEDLKKEWKSNEYEKLSDCPSFKTSYTYREALNVLIKGPKYVDETQLKRMIEDECDRLKEMKQFLLDKLGHFFPVRDVLFYIEGRV